MKRNVTRRAPRKAAAHGKGKALRTAAERRLGMTKAEVKAWRARWKLVNDFQLEEAKRMTPDEKFQAQIQLMHFALSMPESAYRRQGVLEASRRWAKFREVYGDCRERRPA